MESNINDETVEDFSKLTYRQRFAVTEYGYLLLPEDAEIVGKMLGNFQEKEVLPFCQANGRKVSKSQKITPTDDEKTPRVIHKTMSIIYIGLIILNSPFILGMLAYGAFSGEFGAFIGVIFLVGWVIGTIFVSKVLIGKKNIPLAYVVLFSAPVIAWLLLIYVIAPQM